MKIPILADTNHAVSKAYGCLKEDEGIAFRGLYIIDGKGNFFEIPKFLHFILKMLHGPCSMDSCNEMLHEHYS